jgi:hypothetical protein
MPSKFSTARNEDTNAPWTIVVPISGVKPFPGDGLDEVKLIRVTLIEREKLLRSRTRFPLGTHKEFLTKSGGKNNTFESAKMFAVLRFTGTLKEVRPKCLKLIDQELAIFSVCRIGQKRQSWGPIGVVGQHSDAFVGHAFLDPTSKRASMRHERIQGGMPLLLADFWKDYQKHSFFPKLLRILRGETPVTSGWQDDLRRASILIGRSYNCSDVPTAFLFQMIALEALLTRQGDKYTEDLPERIKAFLGWTGLWDSEKFAERIEQVYRRRCGLVHAGNLDSVSIEDLLFVDDIIFNILNNLVTHASLFKSKDDIVIFSKKVAAEQTLGIKPSVRPKTLQFIARKYTDRDKEKI